jgi:trans-aconitate methyltransferase
MTNHDPYTQFAQNYADNSRQSPPWLYFDQPALDAHVRPLLDNTTEILDLGGSDGKVIDYFCDHEVPETNITSVDRSDALVQLARRDHPKALKA